MASPAEQCLDTKPNRCRLCRSISFADITAAGYTAFTDVRVLRDSAEISGPESCDLCALLWWSLRYEIHKIPKQKDDASHWGLRLYRNPKALIQQVDVVATDRDKSQDRIALIGPPYDGWAACNHLSVYAAPGVYTLPVAYLLH